MSKSGDNKKKLYKLIKENPNLPVMIMADNDTMCEGYGYSLMQIIKSVKKLKYIYIQIEYIQKMKKMN